MLATPRLPIVRPLRRVVLLLLAPLAALLPLAAHAGTPGANPAAVRFTIAMQAQGPDSSFSLSGDGVADMRGDVQLHMELNGPEQHSFDYIMAGGSAYISADGAPFEVVTPGMGAMGGLDSSCLAMSSQGNLGDIGTLLGPSASVQNLGTEMLDGASVQHVRIHLDLASAVQALAPLLRQTLVGCGFSAGQLGQLSSPEAQDALAGSTLDLDAYVDTVNQFPRRLDLSIDAPAVPLSISMQETFTPLATPVAITPPAGF
ncbi:MAG TPA: hypothetical protein VFD32_08655 [Dehalococcoidia bacterium]|nr:hypothetical protein [Dehalococcoidia bacterium]